MSFWETTLLGFIAGATIFLGLPLGRLRNPRPRLKMFLNAGSGGRAIGARVEAGQKQVVFVVVVGLVLHEGPGGFGIIGPLAAGGVRGSWPYLVLGGVLAGGPTFVGTMVGYGFHNQYVWVAFL